MASEHDMPFAPLSGVVKSVKHNVNLDADAENIPYHARENALPFTYGNLPVGFNTSELKHIGDSDQLKTLKNNIEKKNIYPDTYTIQRKPARPSISASLPLLRKTPSRKEFEDMLMERNGQAVEANKHFKRELTHNETNQWDLNEMHRILNTPVIGTNEVKETQIESIDLPDAETCCITEDQKPELLFLVENCRSKTPVFPVKSERCVSPYPAQNPLDNSMFDQNCAIPKAKQNVSHFYNTKEVDPHLVKFAKNSSDFWYKPNMSRKEAVDLLRDAVPGTFFIRNSTTYRNAFGLVLRVASPPLGVVTGPGYGHQLVRHFLLEPTTRGVCLMGCTNEPVFTSLSAFVYEHSINQMSLPCTLILPVQVPLLISKNDELTLSQKQMLAQGAACNVLYLYQGDMESLTGESAVRKAVFEMYTAHPRSIPLEIHFKVSSQGITLTDNTRKMFFRRHYPAKNISHFCMDPNNHVWSVPASDEGLHRSVNKSIFAFIARPLTGSKDNQCHIFCDISSKQPASAIVSFANKVLPLDTSSCKIL